MPSPFRVALLATALLSTVSPAAFAQETKPLACKVFTEPLPIQYGGAAMVPAVPASINGVATLAIVSLSSADTTLNKATLEKIGVRVVNSHSIVQGVGGSASEYHAKVDAIAVGQAKGKGRFQVFDGNSVEYGISLGTNYLLRLDLELSLAEKMIRFIIPENCGKSHLAYWSKQAISIPFEVYSDRDLRPIFTIKVDGKEMRAMLATSHETSTIDVHAATRLPGKSAATFGGQGTSRAIGLSKDTLPVWESDFKLIEIGDERITNSKLNVMSLNGIGVDVVLGLDFIRSHRILISMSQRRLYMTYTGGSVFSTKDGDAAWLKSEAESGNADAMYWLAANAEHRGPANWAAALDWYRKAALLSHYGARQRLAADQFGRGELAASAQAFRETFRQRAPYSTMATLFYAAAARSAGRGAAMEELTVLRTNMRDPDPWSNHILDFHLDIITRESLLEHAVADKPQSMLRLCEANFQIGQYQLIVGDNNAARASLQAARNGCPANALFGLLSAAELTRLDSAAK